MALSDWKHEKKIGRGGQGETSLVSHVVSGQYGVLKKIHSSNNPKQRSRLLTEVTNLRIVRSRGGKVPDVLDENTNEFESKNELFFVMSYIEGSCLDEYVNKHGALSLEDATKVVDVLAQTLSLAHESEITHRDIKPKNIIIEHDDFNQVFLLDFGLSFTESETDKTDLGEQIGNRFMALPEGQVYGHANRDPRSDVTQLVGIFLYLLNGGNEPRALLDERGAPPHRRAATAPNLREDDRRKAAIDSLLSRGFSQRVDERFQSVDEFINRLRQIENTSATEQEIPNIEGLARDASKSIIDANLQIRRNIAIENLKGRIVKIRELVTNTYRKSREYSDFQIIGDRNPLGVTKPSRGLNIPYFAIRIVHTHTNTTHQFTYGFILSDGVEVGLVRQVQSGGWSEPFLWLTNESIDADINKEWQDDIKREIAKGIKVIVEKLTNENN